MSLLTKFKKVYEAGTEFKVSSSNIDKEGNLRVDIVDSEGKERFWLHVVERDGQIEWF
jgi:hypothetical protein